MEMEVRLRMEMEMEMWVRLRRKIVGGREKTYTAVSGWNSHGYVHMQISLMNLGKTKLTFVFAYPEIMIRHVNITAQWVVSAMRMNPWDCILYMIRMITGLRCSR